MSKSELELALQDLLNPHQVAVVFDRADTGVNFKLIMGKTPGTEKEEAQADVLKLIVLGFLSELKNMDWRVMFQKGLVVQEVVNNVDKRSDS